MCRRYTFVLSAMMLATVSFSAAWSQEVRGAPDSDARTAALERRIVGLEEQVAILMQRLRAVEGRVEQNTIDTRRPEKRSADLIILKARLRAGEGMKVLHERFQMGSSTHADYAGPGPEVGGSPASVMTFFRDSRCRYYRVFDRTTIELIEKPASWLRGVVDAAMPPPKPKAD